MTAIDKVRSLLKACLAQRYMAQEAQELLDMVDLIEQDPTMKPCFSAEAERLAQKIQDGIRADRIIKGHELEKATREVYAK